jgi:tetratricopeptide (TPR) repeat protein
LPDAPHDPELRRALAAAYLQLGDIQGMPFSVSLGDTAGAVESYRKAEAMARDSGVRDWESLTLLVRARRQIALIAARAGRNAEAVSELNSALDPAKRLWRDAPRSLLVDGKPAAAFFVETNLTLGYTMMHAAAENSSVPAMQQALAQLQRTVGIAEQVQAAHPGMRDLAGSCSQYVGFALEGLGDRTGDPAYFNQAAAAHRRAADAWCDAFAKDPAPQAQRNCADALGEWSWALHRAGQGGPAVAAGARALALMEPMAKAEPESAEAQQDLANAYFHLGAAENTAGKFQQAIGHLHTAESGLRPRRQGPAGDSLGTTKLYVDIQRELATALLGTHNARGAVEALVKAGSAQGYTEIDLLKQSNIHRELEKARAAQAAAAP